MAGETDFISGVFWAYDSILIHLCFVPETLEYLKAGGRVSNASAMIGNLLSIHPCIRIENGKLLAVREQIVGGDNCTIFSVLFPSRLCSPIGDRRPLAVMPRNVVVLFEKYVSCF